MAKILDILLKQIPFPSLNKAEFLVEDAITKLMVNKPGLLRRGLKTEKKTYQELKSILGEVTPNCQDVDCNHQPECFQMEADIILLYPCQDYLVFLLIEVKKSRKKDFGKSSLVPEAFKQLVRDVRFILALMPDVPKDKIIINTLAAFPEETDINELFCNECRKHILCHEDFTEGSDKLAEKLSILKHIPNFKNEHENLMQTVCARMIGLESVEFPYKELNKYFINYLDKIDSIILFDKDQQNVLETIDQSSDSANFAFCGPSGSGKTLVAIKCCNKLIERYLRLADTDAIFVYPIVFDLSKEMKLVKTFQENILCDPRVQVTCMNFTDLKKDKTYKHAKTKIKHLLSNFGKANQGKPCIFLFDEAQLFLEDHPINDWTDLNPKYDKNHVIICFSPIQKFSGKYRQVQFNDSFLSMMFRRRYRNGERIQRLSKHLIYGSRNCLDIDEDIPCLQGEQPQWIDVKNMLELLGNSVTKLQSKTTKYPKKKVFLLYDDSLKDDTLKVIKEAWKESETILNWKEFIGCECDAVVYVSSGDGVHSDHPKV